MKNVLREAEEIIYGAREKAYGHPKDNLNRMAKMWSVILEKEVTPRQVAMCMVATKISRDINAPKRDNLVDIAGYVGVIERIEEEKR